MPTSRVKTDKTASDRRVDGVDFNAVSIAVGLEELFKDEMQIRTNSNLAR